MTSKWCSTETCASTQAPAQKGLEISDLKAFFFEGVNSRCQIKSRLLHASLPCAEAVVGVSEMNCLNPPEALTREKAFKDCSWLSFTSIIAMAGSYSSTESIVVCLQPSARQLTSPLAEGQ